MNYSLAFRGAIAALMLLTVGWKIAIPADRAIDLNDPVIAFLKNNNFNIISADEIVNPA